MSTMDVVLKNGSVRLVLTKKGTVPHEERTRYTKAPVITPL